ncbi:MAG: type II toxin-antitoxin system RelE/ParE family toxin [archaeon]
MYEVFFTERARDQLGKLPREDRERISRAIERARFRPFDYFIRLVGDSAHKLRVGNYRIIADIDGKKLVILVLRVAHRKNVYDL